MRHGYDRRFDRKFHSGLSAAAHGRFLSRVQPSKKTARCPGRTGEPRSRVFFAPASGTSSRLGALAATYFSKYRLFLPSILLTFFYLAGFALCDSYLSLRYSNPSIWIFPAPLVFTARPLLFA